MIPPEFSKTISGRYWRSVFFGNEDSLISSASAPFGRWHQDPQQALYLSASPEGCRIAVKAYQNDEDPKRGIFPFKVEEATVVDLRDPDTRAGFDISLSDIHVFWADLKAQNEPSPTWVISDRLRALGADGLLTPSRSRPDLTHLTLFNWNRVNGPRVFRDSDPLLH